MDTPSTPLTTVDAARSAADLDRAAVLGRDARRAARWYARYLVAFAVASFVLSALYGVLDPSIASWVVMPAWIVFLTLITVWSSRQRVALRRLDRVHLTMIGVWVVVWVVVVQVGTRVFPGSLGWYVLGGLALAVPPLVAAYRVRTRTRA